MSKLSYEVRCKSTAPYYELIAAFDCEQAAKAYAEECERVNKRFAYRVLKDGKVLQCTS